MNRSNTITLPPLETPVPWQKPLEEFVQILRKLRLECPWDRKQTHLSLRPMLVEEAYETVEAIDQALCTGDYSELKKELGDLLLHILFHSEIAREEGSFTFEDVIQAESDKLIYRHPHVFAGTQVNSAEEVTMHWEQLKRRETGRNSILDGVPNSLPALQKSARIQEKASKVGFDWTDSQSVWKKVREEIEEFETELKKEGSQSEEGPSKEEIQKLKTEEFGDLLFSLVNVSRHEGIDAEQALRGATAKFERRFRQVESHVESTNRPFDSFSLDELDAIWDEVKKKV